MHGTCTVVLTWFDIFWQVVRLNLGFLLYSLVWSFLYQLHVLSLVLCTSTPSASVRHVCTCICLYHNFNSNGVRVCLLYCTLSLCYSLQVSELQLAHLEALHRQRAEVDAKHTGEMAFIKLYCEEQLDDLQSQHREEVSEVTIWTVPCCTMRLLESGQLQAY